METKTISVRIDGAIKEEADKLFSKLGLSTSTAINIFMRQAVYQQRLPLEVTLGTPNSVTLAAIEEIESGKAKRFSSLQELYKDLNDDN